MVKKGKSLLFGHISRIVKLSTTKNKLFMVDVSVRIRVLFYIVPKCIRNYYTDFEIDRTILTCLIKKLGHCI